MRKKEKCYKLIILSFIHSFTHSSIHSLIHPFIHSFIHSFIHLFVNYLSMHLCICQLIVYLFIYISIYRTQRLAVFAIILWHPKVTAFCCFLLLDSFANASPSFFPGLVVAHFLDLFVPLVQSKKKYNKIWKKKDKNFRGSKRRG